MTLFLLHLAILSAFDSQQKDRIPSAKQVPKANDLPALCEHFRQHLKNRSPFNGDDYRDTETPALMQMLALEFSLADVQRGQMDEGDRLWSMSRTTAWRIVKRVMAHAGISGRGACPRGLRHSFGVGTLQAGVPITLLQRWLGHARLSTTEIYTHVIGPEEFAFASQFWSRSK
jgi:integrase